MNKKKNRMPLALALAACIALLGVTACASGAPVSGTGSSTPDGLRYTTAKGAVTITGYEGSAKEVVVPAKIDGLPVTAISKTALSNKQLTSLIIPYSVLESMAENSLAGNQLNCLMIYGADNGSVTIFAYSGGNNVVIPAQIDGLPVTVIDDEVFKEAGLASVTLPDGITAIGVRAFISNQLTSVTIPDSVTFIGAAAFGANQLTRVIIPNNVTSIEDGAFMTNQLTSVTIGNGVTSIGKVAFSTNQLTSVTIPSSVTSIGMTAFVGNPLTSVTIGANVDLGPFSFPGNFDEVYDGNGKKAGRYTASGDNWTYAGEQ